MSLPGFTAENSLTEASFTYYGAQSLAPDSETVDPEFLGVIKEFFQKVGGALSGALMSAANALGDAIKNLRDHGGPGGSPFVCGQWVAGVLACRNGQPAYSQAEVLARCVSSNPANSIACASVTAAMWPLIRDACSQNANQVGTLLGQVCK
jgi:hypothetical protein